MDISFIEKTERTCGSQQKIIIESIFVDDRSIKDALEEYIAEVHKARERVDCAGMECYNYSCNTLVDAPKNKRCK